MNRDTRQRAGAGLALGAALLLAGCNCSGVPGPAGEVFAAYCDFMTRCPDQVAFPIAYRSPAECVQILNFVTTCRVEQLEGPGGDNIAVLKQVPLQVDPSQVEACKAYLATVSCDTALSSCDADTDAGCNPCSRLVQPGTGGQGGGTGAGVDEVCESDTACSAGLYCLAATTFADGGQSCRVCKPLRPEGGNCGDPPYVPCGKGLYCDSSGSCAALLGPGEACTGGGQCASTFCHPTSRLCDALGKPGDPCATVQDCRQGFCDAASGTCADRRQNGAACAANAECAYNYCDLATLACGHADGAACTSSSYCQGYCDGTTRLCRTALATGQSCTTGEQCQSRFCHSGNRLCAEPCPLSGDCPAGTYCDSYGACASARGDGATCNTGEECTSGYCNSNDRCATRPGIGDPCTGYGDCFPRGTCSGGVCKALGKPGEACTSLDACMAPFLCKQGTCQLMSLSCQPAPVGQQCTWLQVCDDQGYCDPFQQLTCSKKKAGGESCLRNVECQAGLACQDRVCAPYRVEGETCGNRQTCAPGLFCDASGTTDVCRGPKAAGVACQDDVECESGQCAYVSGTGTVCAAACLMPPPGDQPACHPAKCSDFGFNCGAIDSGCGFQISCGTCSGFNRTCGGGGQPNVCGCTPTRACLPRECNRTVDDGCGTQLSCSAPCDAGTCGGGGTTGICGCVTDRAAGPSLASVAQSTVVPPQGGVGAWDRLGNIAGGDDAGVHVRLQTGGTSPPSEVLLVTGFGFNLPPLAVVNGAQVRVRRQATGSGTLRDQEVGLFSGGARLARKSASQSWSNLWTSATYGTAADLWGYPLTAAQVNAADFGVGLTVTCVGGICEGFVDEVQLTVSYAYRCDCSYQCQADTECGSDGCGSTCGAGCADAGTCGRGYCVPPVFVDPVTGLWWLNESFDRASCTGVTAGGYSGWRAPTLDELRTRVLGCASTAPGGACPASVACASADAGCLDAGCEGCAYRTGPDPNGCYLDKHLQWTACTGAGPHFSSTRDGTSTWTVDFSSGRVSLAGGTATPRYRCVRP